MRPSGRTFDFLARECPACGGAAYRTARLVEILELYLPIVWFSKGRFRCLSCGQGYRKGRSPPEILTPVLFAACFEALREYYPYALAFLAAWIGFYFWKRRDPDAGVLHYLTAWLVLFYLACLALLLRFPRLMDWCRMNGRHAVGLSAGVGAALSLGLAFATLYLDAKWPSKLAPDPRAAAQSQQKV